MTEPPPARPKEAGPRGEAGRVAFVKDSIDPAVWRAIATKAGGEVVSDGAS